MFLKKIEVQGFKSFADKTVLEFKQGVTSIVGPNGSGKSNISDAIRWVMGEMSAKSLRGSSMQDVIFAGTITRKPLNFAEVSLVLDNTDKTFAIDFTEVVVTRRVFRSGESAYFINRSACRMKDIHELFMDTGLGRDGYSIIGQGNVAQILSNKAEDRRSIFEEAAGVSKYKHRKEEAQRKLESVNENLIRIQDIIIELEGQLKPLSEQSEKARKYLGLYEEYKTLDISVCLKLIDKNKAAKKEADKLYESVKLELDALKNKEGELEKTLSSLYEESKAKDLETENKYSLLRENEARSMKAINDKSLAENNTKNNAVLLDRIDAEIQILENEKQSSFSQINSINDEIIVYKKNYDLLLKEFDEIQNSTSDIDRELIDYKNKIESLKGDTITYMNEISSGKAKISGIDNLRKNFLERQYAVEGEIASFVEGLKTTKEDIEKNTSEIIEKKEKLSQMKERVERLNGRKEKLDSALEENIQSINNISLEYQSKSSKKRMLIDMENAYEGYSRSVKTVLKAQELKHLNIFGTVSSLIEVKKEYTTAIEIALGGALQNIIVESEEDAKEAINFLKKTRGGRATFLPISSINGRITVPNLNDYAGFIGVASMIVECDKKYRGIIDNLLGKVAIVDNIDNAISISRKFGYKFRIVTLDGDVLNSGGSMSGGSTNQSSGFLLRANEIKELTSDLLSLTQKGKELKKAKEDLEIDVRNIQNQLMSYIPLVREYEDELIKLENTSIHLNQTIENNSQASNSLTIELAQINEQLAKSNDDIGLIINEISEKEKKIDSLNAEIEILQEDYDKILTTKDERATLLMDKTLKLRSIEKDISVAEEKIKSLQEDIKAKESTIITKGTDKVAIFEENKILEKSILDKAAEIKNLQDLSKNIQAEIEELAKRKELIVNKLKEIQNSNKELTDKVILLQQELTRAESRKEKLISEYDITINRLWDEYELTYTSALEFGKDIENEKEAAKRVGELKAKMKALGSINLDAVDEYQNVKNRFEFLTEQKKDLDESKNNLNRIIESMQELMEEHFSEQFAAINKSFAEVFQELFGGGRGRLYLCEPNNILESGIEIEVQLPGKGLQNINLYSGGEKSFIAIALLFAILNVKPTPFCILDEIDAALDDVNVSRFATYIKNYFGMTQFIVITHRRGTMEAADVLYGVTMQEKGISKLLSLEINEVDEEMAN